MSRSENNLVFEKYGLFVNGLIILNFDKSLGVVKNPVRGDVPAIGSPSSLMIWIISNGLKMPS